MAPQRVASLVSWAGVVLMLAVILIGADGRSWLMGLEPLAAWARAGLVAWLSGLAGPVGVERLVALAGDPRILAALLVIVGTLAGLVSARRHRPALARGFAAAEAGQPGAVFGTFPGWEAAPLFLFFWTTNPPGGALFVVNALALWLVARLAAAGLVSVGERRATGFGARGQSLSAWDATTTTVSLGAMLLVLARAFGLFEKSGFRIERLEVVPVIIDRFTKDI